MSRFRIFALLAALAALTTALAACGGSSSDDPQQVLENATLEGVESGNLDLSLAIEGEGKEGGDVDVKLSGPFQAGEDDLPELALEATAKGMMDGEKIDFDAGLTLLPEKAYVSYDGVDYEVDPTTFGFVKTSFEQAQNQGPEGNAADVNACQESAEGIQFADFIETLRNDGTVDVDGQETTKVSGELDTGSAVDTLIKLAEDPACSAQLEAAGPLPIEELEEAKSELTGAVKEARIEVYVGDDDIVRKVAAEMTIEPEGTNEETVEVDFDLTLSGVNEEQEIPVPSEAQPLQDLFLELGVNPAELLEAASSGEALGELFEELTEGLADGGGSGGSAGAGNGGGGGRQAYLECLKEARTSVDLQQCAGMIQ